MQLPRRGEDDRRHQRGEAPHPGAVRGADHARLQVHRDLAPQRGAVAHAPHPLARPQPGGGGEGGGLQPALQGVLLADGQAELGRERRVGATVRRGREPAADGRLQEQVPLGAEDAARPAPGAARAAPQQLPHEDAAAVRVREAPAGDRLGRGVPGRPAERHPAAAHLLPAVPALPPLLPAQPRPLSGQTPLGPGKRCQTDLEASQRNPHQSQKPRQAIGLTTPRTKLALRKQQQRLKTFYLTRTTTERGGERNAPPPPPTHLQLGL